MADNSNSANTLISLLLSGLGVIAIFVGGYYLFKKLFKQKEILPESQVDVLKAADVITWFKKEENLKLFEENPDFLPVAMKNKAVKDAGIDISEEKNSCIVAIFDKEKKSIVTGQIFVYKEMDDDLKKMFGDKDMIVLK